MRIFGRANWSVASFRLMSNGENHGLLAFKVIERYVAAGAKIDHPFAKAGLHFHNRPSCIRLQRQQFHAISDGFYCPPCRRSVTLAQESIKSLEIS